MARQPFHPTYKNTPTSMASFVIEELPKLAELVGRITINWSGVDLQMSLLLGSLVGVENEASIAVFLSLKNHRSQREALCATADQCLEQDVKNYFDLIIAIHKRLDKQRNDVVHGVWGKAEKTPDGIIWSSLQNHANMLINDYHTFRPGKAPDVDRAYEISKDYFVVKYSDLEELNEWIILLAEAIGHFHGYLRYKGRIQGDNALLSFKDNLLIKDELEGRNK